MINTDNVNFQFLASEIQTATSSFHSYLEDLYDKYQYDTEGELSIHIPELRLVKPELFGISVMTADGKEFQTGDWEEYFTIQSISKVFVYGLALEMHGREFVHKKVNIEPRGEVFNSITLDDKTNRPHNPMLNSGAIAVTDLIVGERSTGRIDLILEMFGRYTGRRHSVNVPVYLSEKKTGYRNRAIAYLMLNFGMISDHFEETLDLYFQQCSIMVNARDLAIMAATLANGGISPVTKKQAIKEEYVQDLMSMMFTCGMYDYSGEWTHKVGIPAKSGIGGGITAVVPRHLGIGTFSPRLDINGNSTRGMKVCKKMSTDFGLHMFNVAKPELTLSDWIEGDSSIDSWNE